jgi:hypothetical protein
MRMSEANYLGLVRGKRLVRGNTILNSVNSPGSVSTSMLPPCCLTYRTAAPVKAENSNCAVPQSTELSVFVDINWHRVSPDRKLLETQMEHQCSDMQKDYRPRVVK